MTDLPRRSYPLLVAPPGGFEDAVGRGRRLRRRRAGGSTGAALMLAGVIAYASIGSPSGNTDGLRPTRQTPQEQTAAPAPGGTPSQEPAARPTPPPPPTATASPAPGEAGRPAEQPGATAAPGTGAPRPPAAPPARETRPPDREQVSRPYAKRGPIDRQGPSPYPASTDTRCITAELRWCAFANVYDDTSTPVKDYELVYSLCRTVDAGPGTVTFDRTQEADYSATHDKTEDTVWTYSAGQRVTPASESTTIPAGYCVDWITTWDGYDDFSYTPPGGAYTLHARSTGRSDTPLPTASRAFTVPEAMG